MSNKQNKQQSANKEVPVVNDEKDEVTSKDQGTIEIITDTEILHAKDLGVEIDLNEQHYPVSAKYKERTWKTGEGLFLDWLSETRSHIYAAKALETEQVGEATGTERTGEEAPVDGGLTLLNGTPNLGLIAEVNDTTGEVTDVRRAVPADFEGEKRDRIDEAIKQLDPVTPVEKIDLEADGIQLFAFDTRMAWIDQNGTEHEKYVKNVLTNYVEIGIKSVDLNKIAVEQKRLWRLYQYIHAHPQEFGKLYNIVVEFGRQYHKELFNLHMFYRAQDGLIMGADEMACFNILRALLLNTIESKNKSKVKALVDIGKVLEHNLIPENVRGLYVAYYQ